MTAGRNVNACTIKSSFNLMKIKSYFSSVKNKLVSQLGRDQREQNRRLFQAQKDIIGSSEKRNDSIFFFTTHKCASTFISQALPILAKDASRPYFDFATCIWRLGDKISLKNPYDLEHHGSIYRRYGEVYGPLRTPIELPIIQECNNILFLRNPFDLLISSYYSKAFSHSPPLHEKSNKVFQEDRFRAKQEGIDKFVIREAKSWILPCFSKYAQLKKCAVRCIILKYDSFFYDFDGFYSDLVEALEMSPSIAIKKELYDIAKRPFASTNADSSNDNIYSHHRSGQSKQYLSKIKPETYTCLSKILQPVLEEFDF